MKKGTAKYSLIMAALTIVLAGSLGIAFDSMDVAILSVLFVLLILGAAIRFNQEK